jgi:hypothetical protein
MAVSSPTREHSEPFSTTLTPASWHGYALSPNNNQAQNNKQGDCTTTTLLEPYHFLQAFICCLSTIMDSPSTREMIVAQNKRQTAFVHVLYLRDAMFRCMY